MAQRDNTGLVKRTCVALLRALCHKANLMILVLGVLLAFRSKWGVVSLNVPTLAATIFQVAGTMVALILPASQLANSYVSKLEDELPKRILRENISAAEKIRITDELTSSLRNNLYPALRASILVFISFVFSVLAMLAPPSNFAWGGLVFSLDSLLVGLALGSLLIGSAWFLPTAQYAFGLEVLNDLNRLIGVVATHQDRKTAESEKNTGTPRQNDNSSLANKPPEPAARDIPPGEKKNS